MDEITPDGIKINNESAADKESNASVQTEQQIGDLQADGINTSEEQVQTDETEVNQEQAQTDGINTSEEQVQADENETNQEQAEGLDTSEKQAQAEVIFDLAKTQAVDAEAESNEEQAEGFGTNAEQQDPSQAVEQAVVADNPSVAEEALLDIFANDDIKGFEQMLEENPKIITYQLGRFPLASVAVLFSADKLLNKLINNYPLTISFTIKDTESKLEVMFSELAGEEADLYSEARFIEPTELFLLQKALPEADRFSRQGGIKTFSSQKRVEYLLKKYMPQCNMVKGKEQNTFKLAKPRTKKQIITIAAIIVLVVAMIVVPLSVLLSLRTNVIFYNGDEEYGNENGISGTKITIESPEKEGYSFTGWYEDKECTVFSNNKLKKGVSSLYAGWEIALYTISFNYQGNDIDGNLVVEQQCSVNDVVKLPILKQDSKLFLGWYDSNNILCSDSYYLYKDTTLSPKFKDIQQEGTDKDPIIITDSADFLYLSTLGDAYFRLDDNIVLSDSFYSCDQLADYSAEDFSGFNGIFDGNGKTITYGTSILPLFTVIGENGCVKNLNIVCNNPISEMYYTTHFGFVAALNNGEINNVDVTVGAASVFDDQGEETTDNSFHLYHTASKLGYAGLVAGGNQGSISHCTSNGNMKVAIANMNTKFFYMGGIVGSNVGNISECDNNAEILSTVYLGGVVGVNTGNIINCFNNGALTLSNGLQTQNLSCMCGGIVAKSFGVVKDCVNNGTITTITNAIPSFTGGIAARAAGEVSNCKNYGDIVFAQGSANFYVGGIVAELAISSGNSTVKNCVNEGTVDGSFWSSGYTGGIAAYAYKRDTDKEEDSVTIEACINKGEIKNTWICGGINGYSRKITIISCRNEGEVYSTTPYGDFPAYAAGISCASFLSVIDSCANVAPISAISAKEKEENNKYPNKVGGLVAWMETSSLSNCYNTGKLTCDNQTDHCGLFAGTASTKMEDCTITNCHSLLKEGVVCGWYAFSTEVDSEGNLVEVDEDGNQIFEAVNADNVYSDEALMYALSEVLGDKFKAKANALPVFVWEE